MQADKLLGAADIDGDGKLSYIGQQMKLKAVYKMNIHLAEWSIVMEALNSSM